MQLRRSAFIALFGLLVIAGPALAAAQRGTSGVIWFPGTPLAGSAVPGAWSTLVTSDAGASMDLHTSGLPAGDAVTVWWVVFNHPELCRHGALGLRCGEGDLGEPSVEASVLFAAGHVIGGSGVGDYGAHLSVGDTAGALFGPGLTNPTGRTST